MTYAIIPAGGKGVRSGLNKPKQYAKINGKELIVYTLEIFQNNKAINGIIVAVAKDYIGFLEKLKTRYNLSKIIGIVEGGKERQDSVFNALTSFNFKDDDLIAVHDAARPFLSQTILTNSIKFAKKNGNALVAIKAKDTLLHGTNVAQKYIDRSSVFYVQTPQIFPYHQLIKGMKKAQKKSFTGTDESMLVFNTGEKVNIFEGSFENFKVTTAQDLAFAKKILKSAK